MKFKVGDKVKIVNYGTIIEEPVENCVSEENKYRVELINSLKYWVDEDVIDTVKPTIDDLRDYMLEHFVDNNGNLDVCGLDFSNFEGNVYITELKCGGDLSQSGHKVNGDLYQCRHKVNGYLYQSGHEIDGHLFQSHINVKQDYNCYNIKYGGNIYIDEPQKTLKEITKEELAGMGYKLKEAN